MLAEPVEMSAGQIARYTAVYDDTNRPLQPRNGRELRVAR
jgi:carbonic anhydrase